MLGLILLLIACFVIFLFFLPFTIVSIDIIRALFRKSKPKTNYQSSEDWQCVDGMKVNSIEDSEGDGLVLFNDPMFPPEEDN